MIVHSLVTGVKREERQIKQHNGRIFSRTVKEDERNAPDIRSCYTRSDNGED